MTSHQIFTRRVGLDDRVEPILPESHVINLNDFPPAAEREPAPVVVNDHLDRLAENNQLDVVGLMRNGLDSISLVEEEANENVSQNSRLGQSSRTSREKERLAPSAECLKGKSLEEAIDYIALREGFTDRTQVTPDLIAKYNRGFKIHKTKSIKKGPKRKKPTESMFIRENSRTRKSTPNPGNQISSEPVSPEAYAKLTERRKGNLQLTLAMLKIIDG